MTDQTTQPLGVIPPERVREILEELHAADPVRYPITPPKPSLAERVRVRLTAEYSIGDMVNVNDVVSVIEQEERPWPSR